MKNKEIEVSFIYGNEDFEKIIKEIVIRKLNIYKNELIKEKGISYIREESSETPIIINSGSESK
ncbi:hypothetical protein SAMN02745163_02464 [Clostridium cavendishii DSM 21758]|uniref:Uncharacterized protein n=1 Tax=Clostridium cavendishii DSM 21758 TaxID=1121302 RepID=A0A1M6LR61_9CLOT|nr:hypothetical protein [Clostridium cavendishii]SHJ73677.1 hypothetical protein SAMN02745163_02464 [Clostridium cavendishii DSM 21758]